MRIRSRQAQFEFLLGETPVRVRINPSGQFTLWRKRCRDRRTFTIQELWRWARQVKNGSLEL